LSLVFEGIVSEFVAIRFIVHVGLIFPVVAACIAAEDVDVTGNWLARILTYS
jgi:hypothetical protein